MNKAELEALIFDTYGIRADYPFEDDPEICVFRHESNQKWFAVSMPVKRTKLPLSGDGYVDVVNLKCAPEVIESLAGIEPGLFPAYHMNKTHWITAVLDGSRDEATLSWLLGISYDLTKRKVNKKRC